MFAVLTKATDIREKGDHLSGKPGNFKEFDSCRGNIREVWREILLSKT